MNTMAIQQIFDTAVSGLFKQNRRSINDEGCCTYRAGNGDKCAVGMIMHDSEYHPKMESMCIDTILDQGIREIDKPSVHNDDYTLKIKSFALRIGAKSKDVIDILASLQSAHDTFETHAWSHEFQRIASEFNLEYKYD